jgi:hypothetical protein
MGLGDFLHFLYLHSNIVKIIQTASVLQKLMSCLKTGKTFRLLNSNAKSHLITFLYSIINIDDKHHLHHYRHMQLKSVVVTKAQKYVVVTIKSVIKMFIIFNCIIQKHIIMYSILTDNLGNTLYRECILIFQTITCVSS